jgi:hypothetical protein
MKHEEAREQVRLRLKSMAEHPGGSMEDLVEDIMALFYLLAPDQELGRALSSCACGGGKPLARGYARKRHLDEYASGVTKTLLLGGFRHYEDDVHVIILEEVSE